MNLHLYLINKLRNSIDFIIKDSYLQYYPKINPEIKLTSEIVLGSKGMFFSKLKSLEEVKIYLSQFKGLEIPHLFNDDDLIYHYRNEINKGDGNLEIVVIRKEPRLINLKTKNGRGYDIARQLLS